MKKFKLFEGINFILKNKNKQLYNIDNKLVMYFNDKANTIEVVNNKNKLTSFIINDKTIEENWTTDGRQKYCFMLYRDKQLIKVITQYCYEDKINKTIKSLMYKFNATELTYEVLRDDLNVI